MDHNQHVFDWYFYNMLLSKNATSLMQWLYTNDLSGSNDIFIKRMKDMKEEKK